MKILHITTSIDKSVGGPSRSVPQTCLALAKLGVEIEIICLPSSNPVKIEYHQRFKVTFMTYKNLVRFAFKLRREDVDLIHLQHVWTPYLSIMAHAARAKLIPYIVTPRGMLEPWIMAKRPLKKKIGMVLYQFKDLSEAKLIHATAEMEAANIRKLGFSNPINVIPNGIELFKLPAPKNKYGSKKMVFLSRIHPKKGIELLLEAWSQIQETGWTLEIAGNGDSDYIDSIKNKISFLGLVSVKLVGPKYGDEKWNLLKSADVFVLPTYSENFGIVVVEALAMGVPVITTTGAPWQELESYSCGWWIDLSVPNLVSVIVDVMNKSPEVLYEMGERGKQLVHDRYSIESIADQLFQAYGRVLGNYNKG